MAAMGSVENSMEPRTILLPRDLHMPIPSWCKKILKRLLYGPYYQYFNRLSDAIADPRGLGMADFLMHDSLHVSPKYRNIFYSMLRGANVIDCGVNRGKFIDLCNLFGVQIIGFEPNLKLYSFLQYKYENYKDVKLINSGVGADSGLVDFYFDADNISDEGFTVCALKKYKDTKSVTSVKCQIIDLCDFIQKEYVEKGQRVYLLKLDVEGAEFGLVEKICKTGIFRHCDYIVVETHARAFDDGNERLQKIKDAISSAGATNIDLDWV
ncbi:MAG: FkbM family methyltransferase [Xanthomonadaceae bacterium]|jgi:FkbM family methyltransferase|nr:FkbM family methyltransferase [Xanthomonadaceae bacterium]